MQASKARRLAATGNALHHAASEADLIRLPLAGTLPVPSLVSQKAMPLGAVVSTHSAAPAGAGVVTAASSPAFPTLLYQGKDRGASLHHSHGMQRGLTKSNGIEEHAAAQQSSTATAWPWRVRRGGRGQGHKHRQGVAVSTDAGGPRRDTRWRSETRGVPAMRQHRQLTTPGT